MESPIRVLEAQMQAQVEDVYVNIHKSPQYMALKRSANGVPLGHGGIVFDVDTLLQSDEVKRYIMQRMRANYDAKADTQLLQAVSDDLQSRYGLGCASTGMGMVGMVREGRD